MDMKILDIALKDLTRSFRSAFAIGMMVIAPLMLTGLIYFAFGGASKGTPQMPAVKVGVVNLDVLPADAPLDAPLGDNIRSMFFDESVVSWISAADYKDEASARSALDNQEIGVVVIIPQGFTEHYLIDLSNKHRINSRVAIFLKEGAFEGARVEFVQEAIR